MYNLLKMIDINKFSQKLTVHLMTTKACRPICIDRIEGIFFFFYWKGKSKYRHISVLKRARNQNLRGHPSLQQSSISDERIGK